MQLCPNGGQGTTCHRQPYICAERSFKELTKEKRKSMGTRIFFRCNPQDFL